MARKPRPDPYSQGSLKIIYEHFFGPLIRYKPQDYSIRDWMDVLFDLKNRDVVRYTAKKAFMMPGHFYAAPLMKVQGLGSRDVKPGTELYVRKDAHNPDVIDVEFQGGQGGANQVFALTAPEWGRVQRYLEEAERKKKV